MKNSSSLQTTASTGASSNQLLITWPVAKTGTLKGRSSSATVICEEMAYMPPQLFEPDERYIRVHSHSKQLFPELEKEEEKQRVESYENYVCWPSDEETASCFVRACALHIWREVEAARRKFDTHMISLAPKVGVTFWGRPVAIFQSGGDNVRYNEWLEMYEKRENACRKARTMYHLPAKERAAFLDEFFDGWRRKLWNRVDL